VRIFIADDAPQLRLLLRRALVGHEIVEAATGDEALRYLSTVCPDVAILDVNMPGLTGLEVCRAIRLDPRHAATYVIIVTANGDRDGERRAREAGAAAFLAKPFSPRRLCELVGAIRPGAAMRPT
jgi:two-component system phosphate regulon response regulator PhoB